jgi:hypothetical protein
MEETWTKVQVGLDLADMKFVGIRGWGASEVHGRNMCVCYRLVTNSFVCEYTGLEVHEVCLLHVEVYKGGVTESRDLISV